jgi:hypothetical protein
MHRNTSNTSKLYKTVTEINNSTTIQNIRNEEPNELEIMVKKSSSIIPVASCSTSQILTQGKCKHVNIFESDSDPDDRFYNSNASITTSNLSVNISTECLPLPLKTDNDILFESSSCEKQLKMSDSNVTYT